MRGMVDPYLKIGRAKKHLDVLDALLKEFTGNKAYTFSRYDDLKQQRYVMECKLLNVPDEICLTVGDAFYNMRSCLDQLVWSLAKRPGKILNPEHTQFPILVKDNAKTRKRFSAQTFGVPKLAAKEIRTFQPYNRGAAFKAHPLWRLNTMCNLDKHSRIPANGSEMIVNFPRVTRTGVVGVQHAGTHKILHVPMDMTFESFDDCIKVSVPLAAKAKLQFDPAVSFKVNFGGDIFGFSEDRNGIGEIYDFIYDVVLPRFMRFFTCSM
jgi:hypothetical protein